MIHETLLQAAQAAINKLFSDRSVPVDVTEASLRELLNDLEIKLEALRSET